MEELIAFGQVFILFVEVLGKSKLISVFIHRTVLIESGINCQLIARHMCGRCPHLMWNSCA